MCNCISETQEAILASNPKIQRASFRVGFRQVGTKLTTILLLPIELEVVGKKKKVIEDFAVRYCPFCGEDQQPPEPTTSEQ